MSINRDMRIDGEYDRPLPERIEKVADDMKTEGGAGLFFIKYSIN